MKIPNSSSTEVRKCFSSNTPWKIRPLDFLYTPDTIEILTEHFGCLISNRSSETSRYIRLLPSPMETEFNHFLLQIRPISCGAIDPSNADLRHQCDLSSDRRRRSLRESYSRVVAVAKFGVQFGSWPSVSHRISDGEETNDSRRKLRLQRRGSE